MHPYSTVDWQVDDLGLNFADTWETARKSISGTTANTQKLEGNNDKDKEQVPTYRTGRILKNNVVVDSTEALE